MAPELDLGSTDFEARAVSPFHEMGAYEALWSEHETTFKSLSERFARYPGSVPSDFISPTEAHECAVFVKRRFDEAEVEGFGVRVHGAGEYPEKLRDAAYPVALLYYQGWWDLAYSRSVAVVGARKPSPEGLARTQRLVRELVAAGFTVVSGLAAGVDRMAHETALEERRPHYRGARHATLARLSEGPRRAATPSGKTLPRHQPGTAQALRIAGLSPQPTLLPRAQRHHVGAHRGHADRRGGRDLRHPHPGPRRLAPATQALCPR